MGNARFGRRARLTTKADFRHVFAQPERSGDHWFTVLARPNALGYPRLGLAISRKAVRAAVGRNRIKRIVRESFRHHQHDMGGIDFVVIGRVNLTGQSNQTLSASLQRHWMRLVKRCAKP